MIDVVEVLSTILGFMASGLFGIMGGILIERHTSRSMYEAYTAEREEKERLVDENIRLKHEVMRLRFEEMERERNER